MRDPREMTWAEREAALVELTPEEQHRMRPLTDDDLIDRVQPRDAVAAVGARAVPAAPGPRYTAPTPPPAELGFDLVKWNRMSRAERRAVLRYAKKREK